MNRLKLFFTLLFPVSGLRSPVSVCAMLFALCALPLSAQTNLSKIIAFEDDEALPPAVWSQDPTLQMFPGGVPTLGTDVLAGWNFTSGWTAVDVNTSITDNNTFTIAGAGAGGVWKSSFTAGLYYLLHTSGSATAASTFAALQGTTSATRINLTGDLATPFNKMVVFKAMATTEARLYLRNNMPSTVTDITSLSAKPLTNFTPPAYANDYSAGGIVEGTDLLAGWNFTNGWTVTSGVSVLDNNSFSTTGAGGIYKGILTANRYYLASSTRTASAGVNEIWSYGSGMVLLLPRNGSGVNFAPYINFYFRNSVAATTDVTTASVKMLTNGIPGIFNGSMETAQPGTNTTGIEKGFIFDGVNDYVAVECTTSTTNSTLSAWVNFSTTGSERYIFGTTTGYVRKSSSEVIQASSGTIYVDGQLYSGSAITANVWHLITVTGIALSGTQLNIGASITPGSYFQGFIDKAGIYNGTLSANQVLKLYNDTKSRYGL